MKKKGFPTKVTDFPGLQKRAVYQFENISRQARREAKNAKVKTLVVPMHWREIKSV